MSLHQILSSSRKFPWLKSETLSFGSQDSSYPCWGCFCCAVNSKHSIMTRKHCQRWQRFLLNFYPSCLRQIRLVLLVLGYSSIHCRRFMQCTICMFFLKNAFFFLVAEFKFFRWRISLVFTCIAISTRLLSREK